MNVCAKHNDQGTDIIYIFFLLQRGKKKVEKTFPPIDIFKMSIHSKKQDVSLPRVCVCVCTPQQGKW